MFARLAPGFALVSVLALLSGCGEDAPSYTDQGKEQTCEEECKLLQSCDKSIDVSSCESDCATNDAISLQGQEVITSCVREQECDQSNPVRLVDCIDDGLGVLEPSPAGQAFCAGTLDVFAECTNTKLNNADRDDCLDGVSILTDEVVSHLTDCSASKETCETRQLCAALVLRDLNPAAALGEAGQGLATLLEGLLKSGAGSPP
jgi:hypothetical protein